MESKIKTIEWKVNESGASSKLTGEAVRGFSRMVDQTLLPYEFKYVDIKTGDRMYDAIKTMVVRGAPAIGVAGAQGIALYAQEGFNKEELLEKCDYLESSRPTAVNLRWAIEKQREVIHAGGGVEELIQNGIRLQEEDIAINKKIGDFGAAVVPKGATILTHCNAGALATVGYGTALGVVRSAFANDPTVQVFADETRPRQQGARITTLELTMDGIPTTLITDGMCSYFMKKGMIDLVVVGADRIATNGDTANKIGTYTVAIAAKYHNVPFYVAAPLSTIDVSIKTGDEIPIEERDREEVTHINGKIICAGVNEWDDLTNQWRSPPTGVNVINPGFDVTPAELITGIITEAGILRPDYRTSIKATMDNPL